MSDTNGTSNGKPLDADDFLRKRGGRATQGYRSPQIFANLLGLLNGESWFTWLEADLMRRDPQVILALAILRAPMYGVTWKIKARNTAVAEFIDATLTRIWQRALRKILHFLEYGIHAGEITYCYEDGKVRFDHLYDVHPRDARPLEFKEGMHRGDVAGVRINPTGGNTPIGGGTSGMGRIDLLAPHAWWFTGASEYSALYSRPVMAGAFLPWKEKRGRNGAVESRRLWYKKCAFHGPRMRYPDESTDMGIPGAPNLRSNQDLAREIAEKFENGGILALPNDLHPGDNTKFAWQWEDSESIQEVAGLREYPKDLDREILIGMEIPPELVEAATVGSGYSGRAIPSQVFFTIEDERARLVVEAADRMIIRGLVTLNYGPKEKYEIEVDSLAAMVARQSEDAGKPAAGKNDAKNDDTAGDNGGSGGAGPGGSNGDGSPVQLSLDQQRRIKELADAAYPDMPSVIPTVAPPIAPPIRLGHPDRWKAYRGPHGGHGWQSTVDPEIIKYQAERPSDHEAGQSKEETTRHPDHDGGFDAVAAKLPDAVKADAGLIAKAKAFYQRFYVATTNLMLKVQGVAPEVLDTADDFGKIFYASRPDAHGNSVDPMVSHFGVSSNTVAVVASHVLGRAAAWMRKKLRMALEATADMAAKVVEVFKAIAEEVAGLPVPTVEEVSEWLESRKKAR